MYKDIIMQYLNIKQNILATFLSATIQRDSKSTHFESLKHFSNCLLISTAASDCLPLSKCCAASGVNSTFMCIIPSFGRDNFGCCISHDTCATALQTNPSQHFI